MGFGRELPDLVTGLGWPGWPRVVVLADPVEIGSVLDACRSGAGGVLCGPPLCSRGAALPEDHELTTREVDVIHRVADGRSNLSIGHELGLSGLTVKGHLARIGRKLSTGDRAGMVATAMRRGIIS